MCRHFTKQNYSEHGKTWQRWIVVAVYIFYDSFVYLLFFQSTLKLSLEFSRYELGALEIGTSWN